MINALIIWLITNQSFTILHKVGAALRKSLRISALLLAGQHPAIIQHHVKPQCNYVTKVFVQQLLTSCTSLVLGPSSADSANSPQGSFSLVHMKNGIAGERQEMFVT